MYAAPIPDKAGNPVREVGARVELLVRPWEKRE